MDSVLDELDFRATNDTDRMAVGRTIAPDCRDLIAHVGEAAAEGNLALVMEAFRHCLARE